MSKKKVETLEVAKKAAITADLAADNIRKYNALHGDSASASFTKPLVMKVADAADAELKAAIDASAKAAINNLQRYLDLKGE
ncbi:hypothetical protein [Shewanella frigidimarina]|uniref:hypothetical protein n=1 Tax=Shewanella frigidimarina TaxID=56812 RepID=UPI003D798F07